MNQRFLIDPVTAVRVLADNAEKVAHHSRRTATFVEGITQDVKAVYDLVYPFVEWLKSNKAHPSAKV